MLLTQQKQKLYITVIDILNIGTTSEKSIVVDRFKYEVGHLSKFLGRKVSTYMDPHYLFIRCEVQC